MHEEGLRLGMFLAGVVMAAAPVALGVVMTVWLVRMYRREQAEAAAASTPSSSGDQS